MFILVILIALYISSSTDAAAQVSAGLIAQDVGAGAARQAGIKPQDRILSWSGKNSSGSFVSPFDPLFVESEYGTRGPVTIEGFSGGEKRVWIISPGASWLLQTNPASQNKSAMSSWTLFTNATELIGQRKWREADEVFAKAILLSIDVSLSRCELEKAWADSLYKRNEFASAEKHYLLAINDLDQLSKSSLTVAGLWDAVGRCSEHKGELSQATLYYRRALDLASAVEPASLTVASALNGLGRVDRLMDRPQSSQTNYLRALSIEKAIAPNQLGVASIEHNLAMIAIDSANLGEAEKYTDESLAIRLRLSPRSSLTAASYINRGNIAFLRDDLASAEKWFLDAQAILEEVAPEAIAQATVLTSLANVAAARWDLEASETYWRRAEAIEARVAPDTPQHATTLMNLASIIEKRGSVDDAEQYLKRAMIIAKPLGPNVQAACLNVLGDIELHRGSLGSAQSAYTQSLALSSELDKAKLLTADDLYELGFIEAERHSDKEALKYYHKALALLHNVDTRGAALVEFGIASVYRGEAHNDLAIRSYQEGMSTLEREVSHVGGTDYSKSIFRNRFESYLVQYIGLLISAKRYEHAFFLAEEFKARTLLEMMRRGNISLTTGIPPALVSAEANLRYAISEKQSQRLRLMQRDPASGRIAVVNKELDSLLLQRNETQARIRDSNPTFAHMMMLPTHSQLKAIQKALQSSTLIEFSLGSEESYAFVVTSDSLAAYRLPPGPVINSAARRLLESLRSTEHRIDIAGSNRLALALSKLLFSNLPSTVIDSTSRLVIVADGGLEYVPFSLLLSSHEHLLINQRDVVYAPSAAMLTVRRQLDLARTDRVLIVADPVFSRSDIRVARNTALRPADVISSESNPDHIARLIYSQQEAALIASFTGSAKTKQMVGFDANREALLSMDLTQFRILHFATHGIFDADRPSLSGLLLSMVDRAGNPSNGVLGLEDVFNLRLHADLVVLSGCETALGRDMSREGIVGLTTGFMYAGAKQVVASLWMVDDEASTYFMALLFAQIEQHHASPSQALRLAQLQMSKDKRWDSPFYWASFVIQGNWL